MMRSGLADASLRKVTFVALFTLAPACSVEPTLQSTRDSAIAAPDTSAGDANGADARLLDASDAAELEASSSDASAPDAWWAADAGQAEGGVVSNPPILLSSTISFQSVDILWSTTKKYRLGMLWVQPTDYGSGSDSKRELALDLSFDGKMGPFTLPMSLPGPSEYNLLCARNCTDELVCPCNTSSAYRIGVGLIVVVEDTNGNGKIDFAGGALTEPGTVGVAIAYGALIYSANGGDVLPLKNGQPYLLDGTVSKGALGYVAHWPDGGSSQRMRAAAPGEPIPMYNAKEPHLN